jgi:hypothetical protein
VYQTDLDLAQLGLTLSIIKFLEIDSFFICILNAYAQIFRGSVSSLSIFAALSTVRTCIFHVLLFVLFLELSVVTLVCC